MVAVIMVAEEFGTGRGTLFDILELLFGEDYVVPCDVRRADGKVGRGALQRPAGQRADRHRQRSGSTKTGISRRGGGCTYEALKNAIEPSPTARRRFEAKGQHAYAQRSARSTIIATQHRDVVKLPRDDRRIRSPHLRPTR